MNTLRRSLEEYLAMRRGLGFKLQQDGEGLHDFVTFMEGRGASYITQRLALAWAQRPANAQPARWASRLTYVRQFARYRSATDPRTQIPAPGLLPFKPKRARPYLYSADEIKRLLSATLNTPLSPYCNDRKGCALLPWVYYCSVWAAQRLRSSPGRSAQSKASRRRSEDRGLDDPRRQIW